MTQAMRFRSIVALCLISIGIVFAFLPDAWIELWCGLEPDGGNGWAEILLVAVPLGLGLILGSEVLVRYRRLRERSLTVQSAPHRL
jgi:hypothetical protein